MAFYENIYINFFPLVEEIKANEGLKACIQNNGRNESGKPTISWFP